jgi:hypothetical protein
MTPSRTLDIKVGDFSQTPYGRYATDGKHCGERFRETVLRPAFEDEGIDTVNLHLDTIAEGYEYGSGFLEEAFGGLVRVNGMAKEAVLNKIRVITVNGDDAQDILSYIQAAQ